MKVAGGAAWAVGSRLLAQGFQFIAGIFLARLLSPAEFGLVAAIYAITGIALIFLDLGLGAVVIRWQKASQEDLSTLFWVNILNGVAFSAIVFACAPLLASFYGQPALRYLAPLASFSFLLSFGAVHGALLSRSGRFREVAVIAGLGTITSTSATLGMAAAGLGAVSLAAGPAVGAAAASVGFLFVGRWAPSLSFRRTAVASAWRFSRGIVGAQAIEYVAQNADSVLLGRQWGPSVLGAYNRAFNLMLIPVNQITGALGSVLYPALARMQDDRVRLKLAFERAVAVIFCLSGGSAPLLAVVAPDVVTLLYGERWSATIVPLQWLCLAGLARVSTLASGWMLQVLGATGVMFRLALIEAALTVVGIALAVPYGAIGVAIAVAAAGVVYLPINILVTYRALGQSVRDLAAVMLRSALCIGLAVVVGQSVTLLGEDWATLARFAATAAAAVATFALGVLCCNRRLLDDVRALVRRR